MRPFDLPPPGPSGRPSLDRTSRRRFLSSLVWTATATATGRGVARAHSRPTGGAALAAPNLSDDQIVRFVAGIRPFRRGGLRIEREEVAGKTVVHNYGHGGAGYTLSWGSAILAADLLHGVARGSAVAVLGSGVVGLCTARVLQERGLRVRVYAREFPPHTTSDVAGAEWSPDIVARGATPELRKRFDRMLTLSWRRFQPLVGSRWGVRPRPIYEAEDVPSGLDDLPVGLARPPRRLAALPFAPARSGRVYQTLLIEAPIFLAALVDDVRRAGGILEPRTLATQADLQGLPEPLIVNCLGVGAGAVFADPAVVPIRGQLVHLRPQPLSYLLDHPDGYMVPRSDALVLGGTFETGVADLRPDPAACARILEDNRRFFGPRG
jgi:D-amino-acid oxidase